MARPRSFDADTVLAAARDLFWQQGFQATSLDQLARATGVNKPSLYAAFGDKAALFLAALRNYHQGVLAMSGRALAAQPSARAALQAWLLAYLPYCSGESGARGCLSLNTANDAGACLPAVRSEITCFQAELESLLAQTIERGRRSGEFSTELDCARTARLLMVAQYGLLALASARPSPAATRATMTALLDALMPCSAPNHLCQD